MKLSNFSEGFFRRLWRIVLWVNASLFTSFVFPIL